MNWLASTPTYNSRTVVKNLRRVARYATDQGKTIALEPLKRFETDFINTCEQGLRMIADVGDPGLKLHLDTFHMNIEEKDPATAIRGCRREPCPFSRLWIGSRHSRG